MSERLRILVSGMLGGVPAQGGASWAVLQWILGLSALGHEVTFAEETGDDPSEGAADYFTRVCATFDVRGGLFARGGHTLAGVSYKELAVSAATADLVVNLGGTLRAAELLEPPPLRAYIDLDPAFTQIWHAQDVDVGLAAHNRFATVGLGLTDADLPTCGVEWLPTLPPVFLERWPSAAGDPPWFTTVGNWRSYGPVEWNGVVYAQKAHSLRELLPLPRRVWPALVLAFAIDPGEQRDLDALREHGWELADPQRVAVSPTAYASFIRASRAELGIAKAGYVRSRCGWFSDRSACYLASGRPVVAQDTGVGKYVPTGPGFWAFGSVDEAAELIDRVDRDWVAESRAARRWAEEHLDSGRVLPRFLDAVMAG